MTDTPLTARRPVRRVAVASLILLAAATAGCAGGKATKPGSSLADAETAVARAERARIGDYDPASWKAARENLAEARSAANGTDKDAAALSRWYAARARADAELGMARAERARLAALTMSLKREIAGLQSVPASPAPAPNEAMP